MQKTNNDWWSARRASGQEGYVPANYVKEIEPKVIRKTVKRPVKEPVKVIVQKTGTRKEFVKKKRTPSSKLRRTPSGTLLQIYQC
jgi:spectrin beta